MPKTSKRVSLFRKREESPEFRHFFKNVLGYRPRRTRLYHVAFTHRSLSSVEAGHRVNNERLEYLGDAVLGMVVAEYLYKRYPLRDEGFLTEMRSKLVSRKSLGELSRKMGMTDLIEHQQGGDGSFKSIGGDALEALIGAIYIEKGFRFTRRLIVKRLLSTYLDVDSVEHTDWNYKSKLIDWGQKHRRKITFETIKTKQGKSGGRCEYQCLVRVDSVPQQSAVGYTIKSAEQLAAEKSYKAMEDEGKIAKKAGASS